jgi:hypothetical protein
VRSAEAAQIFTQHGSQQHTFGAALKSATLQRATIQALRRISCPQCQHLAGEPNDTLRSVLLNPSAFD